MKRTIRSFMLLEAATLAVASLFHSGVVVSGYVYREGSIVEGVLAAVLIAGFVLSLARPAYTFLFGLLAQGFALFGTLVGLFFFSIGHGPRTAADIVFLAALTVLLLGGLILAARSAVNLSKDAFVEK